MVAGTHGEHQMRSKPEITGHIILRSEPPQPVTGERILGPQVLAAKPFTYNNRGSEYKETGTWEMGNGRWEMGKTGEDWHGLPVATTGFAYASKNTMFAKPALVYEMR